MLGETIPDETRSGTLETLPLDKVNLAQALTEFAQSDFVHTMFNYFNVQDVTSYGTWWAIFESVDLNGVTITLRLKAPFDAKRNELLERLSKYLRARLGRVEIHAVHRDGRDIW